MVGLALAVVVAVGVALTAGRDSQAGLAGQPAEAFTHVHGLAYPGWAEHLFLATHRGLLVVDETGPWRYASEEAHDLMGFSADPDTAEVLYASGHPAPGSRFPNPVGFLVSRDGGRTWDALSLSGVADFHAMAVDQSGQVVYGWNVSRDPGLYRSEDGGRSWDRPDDTELWAAGGVFSLASHPVDPHRVAAGTEAGLFESTDGGRSWEMLLDGSPVTAVKWVTPDRIVAYVASPQVGLVISTDDANTWTQLGLSLPDDAVAHTAAHPADPEILYLGTFGEALLRTDDGGQSWQWLAVEGVPLETPQPVATGTDD